MSMKQRKKKYVLLDHLCRNCGGRMAEYVDHGLMTGGGNPIFECVDCGQGGSDMGPEQWCWCGFHFKGQEKMQGTYMCVPFSVVKEKPELKQAFYSCGSDPDSKKALIGVVTRDEYTRVMNK